MAKPSTEELGKEIFSIIEEYYGKKKFKATDLTKVMRQKFGHENVSSMDIKKALRPLIDSGRLIYGYFLGTTIEIPHEEGAAMATEDATVRKSEPVATASSGDTAVKEEKTFSRKKLRMRGGSATSGKASSTDLRPFWSKKDPPCSIECPAGANIREWLTDIREGNSFEEAFYTLTDKNPFPSTMGRICPHPCETKCNRNELDEPVGINSVEGAIGDYAIKHGLKLKMLTNEKKSKKVAVIGAGPSGLSAAYQLVRRGYPVTVFEKYEKAGGMLRYGIPPYRLPDDVLDAEIQRILDLGVELKTNCRVGENVELEDIRSDYDAIYFAIGNHQGMTLGVGGEDANNVYTAASFLSKVNNGEKVDVGSKVLVVGGGDSAIDAARTSRRLGAEVTLLYRRSIKEMPAIEHEISEAELEGVKYEFLATPVEIIKNGNNATKVKAIRMELKEADASGRARPVPIEGSEFEIEIDTIIAALGQRPDFSGLEIFKNEKGWITVDGDGKTTIDKVYAGGDITADVALATMAIGEGRRKALTMAYFLENRSPEKVTPLPIIKTDRMRLDHYEKTPKLQRSSVPLEERLKSFDEVINMLSQDDAAKEAARCMSCGMCFDCEKCYLFCQDGAVEILPKGQHYKFILNKCTGCKKCMEECPCGYIDMQ